MNTPDLFMVLFTGGLFLIACFSLIIQIVKK